MHCVLRASVVEVSHTMCQVLHGPKPDIKTSKPTWNWIVMSNKQPFACVEEEVYAALASDSCHSSLAVGGFAPFGHAGSETENLQAWSLLTHFQLPQLSFLIEAS